MHSLAIKPSQCVRRQTEAHWIYYARLIDALSLKCSKFYVISLRSSTIAVRRCHSHIPRTDPSLLSLPFVTLSERYLVNLCTRSDMQYEKENDFFIECIASLNSFSRMSNDVNRLLAFPLLIALLTVGCRFQIQSYISNGTSTFVDVNRCK